MSCSWNNEEHTEILLIKTNGDKLILKPKDCIKYDGRECVRIEEFARSDPGIGPIGFTYLPWRAEEKRWATFSFSLSKGDTRRLVCKPEGIKRFVWGEHPDWDTVEIIPNPECIET